MMIRPRAELRLGKELLIAKLEMWDAPLVVFAFKAAAVQVFDRFPGNGFMPNLQLGSASVFVMPGPYESRGKADRTLDSLRSWLGDR